MDSRVYRLYPDVVAVGGIAAAVRAIADEQGLDIGRPGSDDWARVRILGASPGREHWTVTLAPAIRSFGLNTAAPDVEQLFGRTADLRAMVTAAAAWRGGATTREVKALAPFVRLPLLAEAHARGPADAVECSWQLLHERGRREAVRYRRTESRLFGDTVAAAYAEPRLRQLYPVTSHWNLWFSSRTEEPFDKVGPALEPCGDGYFRVWAPKRTLLGESRDAREAAAIAAAALPGDCGPAVQGVRPARTRP